jgi:hypothetical protein
MAIEPNESIWRQIGRHGDGMGEDLACCYGNLIDAACSKRKSTLCAELVTWKRECHVAKQSTPDFQITD